VKTDSSEQTTTSTVKSVKQKGMSFDAYSKRREVERKETRKLTQLSSSESLGLNFSKKNLRRVSLVSTISKAEIVRVEDPNYVVPVNRRSCN
jgi:hypothetical protein